MGFFDGKVVIVTGSGGGIGRAHALAFAREGASVVVNDLGGARDGSGESHQLADRVAKEIQAAGGKAAASYDSVATAEGATRIVDTAIEAFGRVDVLVNNAGILRDKTLLKMDEPMWDIVIAVHLKGTFLLSKLAAERMVQQVADGKATGGRIVNTTSLAGLKGNFGQSNYAAAKAGIYGLTLVNAIELKKHGVTVNAIAPMAKTRLTEDIDMVPEEMKPELISPVVLWLASDLAKDVTGRVFGVHGRRVFEYKMEMTDGVEKPGTAAWTPEEIQKALPQIEAQKPAAAGPGAAAAGTAPQGPPAGRDLPSIVDRLVKAAPTFFIAERAGGMKTNFHLHVKGARAYTIRIENGKCEVMEGHQGTPTCNIKTDAETYVGMAEGKVNPQKAFMEQKLSADNIPEAMKYAMVFRPPKPDEVKKIVGDAAAGAPAASAAAAASAPAQAAGGAASQKDIVDEIFRRMPEAFVPAKAGNWKAAILFKVQGAGDYTIDVDGAGGCKTGEGAPPKPSCTVKVSAETLIGMVEGKISGQKAFMEGKISADNLSDMMKFGAAFDLKKGAAMAAAQRAQATSSATATTTTPATALAAGSAPAAAPPAEGLNRAYVGRVFPGSPQFARPEMLKAYALATNDPNPAYLDDSRPGGIVAPPIFPVRLTKEVMFKAVTDPGLNADLLRLVHGEQDMKFFRPIRPWDLVATRATIAGVEDKSSGQILKVTMRCYVEGELAVQADQALFIRASKKAAAAAGAGAGEKKGDEAAAAASGSAGKGEVLFESKMKVTDDQTLRYAEASGDNNPIHVDPEVAKMAGFPAMILQGLCTMAFASRAIVLEACAGNPTRLKRFAVRFSKPVFPGDELVTRAWRLASDGALARYGFETVNQAGVTVITNGLAEVVVS